MFKKFNLKKIIISILSIILICSVSLFVGCNTSESTSESSSHQSGELYNPNENDNKQTLSIDAVREVELGDTLKLTVHSTNINTKLIWTSSDVSVATVNDNGEITTISVGQTVITVSAGSLSASCTLTVYQTSRAPIIFLDSDDITIGVNSKYSVNVTSVKWNNQEVQVSDLNWVYKNEPQAVEDKVVSITPSSDGKTVEIEGLKSGKAELTVSCSYFNNLGAKTINVEVLDLETMKIEGLEYVGNDTYKATTYTEVYTKTVGQTTYNYQDSVDFSVMVYKGGELIQAQPEFTIADTTVAKIENGKIFGLKEGETTITCSYNGLERTIRFVCARPVIDLTEQNDTVVDCYTSTSIEISQTDAIQGSVNTVYFSNDLGESFVEVGSYTDGVVTIDQEKLQTSKIGSGILKLSEDKIDYVFSCGIYTMVIDDAEKLNKLSEESKKMNSQADIFDGYFILGADITMPKGCQFNEVATDIVANGQNGFVGIFDGQGYQIDGLSIDNGGLFAVMGESAVVKNVSFTNASVKDSGFISSKGAGLIQNLYIDYKEITVTESCNGFVGTFFVNGINGQAIVSNCVVLAVDASYNSNDKSYKKLFVIGGTTKDAGVYSDILVTVKPSIKDNHVTSSNGKNFKNSNDNYIVGQNKEAVAENFTSFTKTWDRDYWKLDGVAFPTPTRELNVIEHSWGSLVEGVKATCVANGTSAYKECQHCSAIAICDESGNILNVTTNRNDLTILAGHTSLKYENGELKCKDCSTVCHEFNLNVHDLAGSYASDNNSIKIDFSSLSITSVTSIKIGNKDISGYTVDGSLVTIPYSSFCISEGRYYFGNQTLSITYDNSNKVDLSVLLKTKVIKSANDLQDFGKIALAQSDNSQITDNTAYKFSGYFELGADIDCNGARYTMVANSSQHVSATVNGFGGVFDGKGYTISNLLVGADKMWYNGWDDTPDTCYDTYSLFGRLDGGKICNINFTGVMLNPMSSLLCSSGYGEISNIYAQISRCAIITDVNDKGELAAYFPLSLCFSNGVNGDLAKVSVHDVLVDYVNCEYLGLNKGNEYPYGSGLATYDEFGFVDNQKIYSVFGLDSAEYLQNCYVVGYPGQAWNNEILFRAYTDMNVGELGNFNGEMFAIRGNMLLPLSLANVYDGITSLDVTIDKHIVISGEKIKVDLGDAISFANFVTESDKISFSNGYIKVDSDAIGEISFKFTLKMANGELLETEDIVIRVFANEDDVFAVEVESWESEEIGAVNIGSALNSSEALSETLGGFAIYKTNGGYGQSIVNTSIVASNYSELYFAFKADQRVTLSNGDYSTNVITPNVWYVVKLERHVDGTWSIYTKGISDGNYVEFSATTEFFGVNATFDTMFRTYLWIADAMQNNHQVYATDVWGVVSEQYLSVEGLIDSLPSAITTANVNDVFTVYNAYQALNEEQKAKVNVDKLAKLNNSLGQVFELEVSTWTGANKVLENALNDTAVKVGTFGSYDIYSKTGLGYGGSGIGSGNIQINDYKEVYFMVKSTYPVSIFSGDWQAPKLEVNKWYAVKLVKGEEHWHVYRRELCQDSWTELVLDNYDSLKSTEPVWFNSAFVSVTWDANVSYDVFASGLWCIGQEDYEKVELLIDKLPDTITSADIDAVLTAYSEYNALSAEQQAKLDSARVEKLNNSYAQIVGLEIEAWEEEGLIDTGLNALLNGTSAGVWGNLSTSNLINAGTDYIANTGIDSKAYEKLYFAFKTDKQVSLCSADQNVITANTWYFVKLEKQEDGSWTISAKVFGESDYVELTANEEFFGAGNATFITMFRTYSWDGIAYNVYATNVWGKSIVGGEIADWENAGAVKLGSAINSSDATGETLGGLAVYKTNGGYGQSIVNTAIDSSDYSVLYFAFKTDKDVMLSNGDYGVNMVTPNTWYFVKLEKQGDGSWTISAKKVGDSDYTPFTASTEFFGAGNATFETMFRTYLWTSDTYNHEVYATDVWGVSAQPHLDVENFIDSLPSAITTDNFNKVLDAYDAYKALSAEDQAKVNADKLAKLNSFVGQVFGLEVSTWAGANKVLENALNDTAVKVGTFGDYDIYSKTGLGAGGNGIGSGNIQINDYKEVYFMFKVTYPVSIFSGDSNAFKLEVNKWYAIKLVKGVEQWSVYQRELCSDTWVELVLDNYDSLKSTSPVWFNAAFVSVTWDTNVSYDVFASGLWCVGEEEYDKVVTLIDKLPDTITSADIDAVLTAYSEYNALSAEQQAKIDSARVEKLNNSYAQIVGLEIEAWEEEGLTDTGLNALLNGTSAGAWGDLSTSSLINAGTDYIANTGIDSKAYAKLYFAFKTDKQVSLCSADQNVITANTWYFVKLEKQEDGSWTISAKAFGESDYVELTANEEFFGAGNATFITMFRTYSWDGIAYNVYATNVWGVSIIASETTGWKTEGAVKLGSAINSSDALDETLGGLTVYKTNGGYGQSIVNKAIDSSNYSVLYFAFKATQQVNLSNGLSDVNVITPNTWYFVKLEKQADGSWTIFAKKVGDSDYTPFTASTEFFGAGNATFETMFRTYLWTSDTYNHEVYATDVWGKSVVGGEIATWENAGAVKLGSAINSSDAIGETLGGLTVYKTNGGYGQSIVNKSIDSSNYSKLYFAFKATAQVTLSNGDYQTNVITPNTWYFVKLEKQEDGSWTISAKKVGDSDYIAFTASTEFFGAGNATFETMFRTYLWTSDTYNHEVYATDVWGK